MFETRMQSREQSERARRCDTPAAVGSADGHVAVAVPIDPPLRIGARRIRACDKPKSCRVKPRDANGLLGGAANAPKSLVPRQGLQWQMLFIQMIAQQLA